MKTTAFKSCVIALSVLFGLFTSCISSQSFMPVKGHGTSVTRDFTVSDFHGIEVSNGFDVTLVQGDAEALTLTAQENLFEYIIVKVDQGTLKIYSDENMMATQPLKARITFKSIDKLRVSGGGDVVGETSVDVNTLGIEISGGGDFTSVINTGELDCRISGGGDAKIDGRIGTYKLDLTGGGDVVSDMDVNILNCTVSGGGDLTLRGKKASEAVIHISGGGDLEVEMELEKMNCSVSGGGNASLRGSAVTLDIEVNGGGDINAASFTATNASFQASGGSDIRINATKELSGQISGGGDVYYSGSPEIVTIDARGGSEIHKQ
jgi:hypothetical protein